MQKYNGSLIRQFPNSVTGNSAAGVFVGVFISGTSTPATLYEDDDTGGATLPNPLVTNNVGFYSFYAADGKYRIEFSATQYPDLEVQLLDSNQVVDEFGTGSGLIGQAATAALVSIAADVAAVDASRVSGQSAMTADVTAVDNSRINAQNLISLDAAAVDAAATNALAVEIPAQINRLGLQYPPIAYISGLALDSHVKTYSYDDALYIWGGALGTVTTGAFNETGWQPIQGDVQLRNDVTKGTSLIRDVKHLSGIFELGVVVPQYDGQQFSVAGFYIDTVIGGGVFVWDAARDKADHNGGTVIAPEAIVAWDGTQSGLATLLNWTGSGSGCYVKLVGSSIAPDEFGAIPDIDNKNSITAAAKQAKAISLPLQIGKLFKTSPLTFDGTLNGLVVKGSLAPTDVAGRTTVTGFAPFTDGQTHVLQLGTNSSTFQGGRFDDICIYGDDLALSNAGLVIQRWSQGYSENFTVRNIKALGVNVVKMEDCEHRNFRVLKVGDPINQQGGMQFSKSPDLASNIIRFFGGRFEWIDGPHVQLSSEAQAAVSHVWFFGTKFEVAERDGYGSTRSLNPLFRFKADLFYRCQNINFVDIWIAQATRPTAVFELGNCDSFTASGFTMSAVVDDTITIAHSDAAYEMRSLKIENYKVINTSGDFVNFKVLTDIQSTVPIKIEYPTVYNGDGFNICNKINSNLNTSFECGLPSRLDIDQDSMNPSKQVMIVSGSNNNAICNLSSVKYSNISEGYNPENYNQLVNVKFRAKSSGTLCRLELRAGGDYMDRQDVTGDWAWYELGGTMRDKTGNLQIVNSASSSVDSEVKIDLVLVEFGREHRITTFVDLSGQYESGDIVTLKRAVSGPFQKLCTVSGDPATFINTITV